MRKALDRERIRGGELEAKLASLDQDMAFQLQVGPYICKRWIWIDKHFSWKTQSWKRRERGTMLTCQQLTLRWRANTRKGGAKPQINQSKGFAHLHWFPSLLLDPYCFPTQAESWVDEAASNVRGGDRESQAGVHVPSLIKGENLYHAKKEFHWSNELTKNYQKVEELQEQLSRERSENSSIGAEMKVFFRPKKMEMIFRLLGWDSHFWRYFLCMCEHCSSYLNCQSIIEKMDQFKRTIAR